MFETLFLPRFTQAFCPQYERISQYQRRQFRESSSRPSAWRLSKYDTNTVQRNARIYSYEPERHKSRSPQSRDWRTFRRRGFQYPPSVCIPYKWYGRCISHFYVTADRVMAGQYGFLNRVLYYCMILFAVLAASKSWLCWVRLIESAIDSFYRHASRLVPS